MKVFVTQPCPTLCKPMDCSLQGSSVHGILQARILEGVVFPFFRNSPNLGIKLGLLHCGQILYCLSPEGSPSVSCSVVSLCDPMGCNLPDSSFCGILQARTLEWVAIPFSRGSSWPRELTWVSFIAGGFFTIWGGDTKPNWTILSLKEYSPKWVLPPLLKK